MYIGVRKLLYLNATLPKPDEGTFSIPTPRVMMLIKHMLSWFDEENTEIELNPALIAESAKTFTGVVSLIQDMYGEHWQLLFDFVINCWSVSLLP
jgi:preprotein translocase subunit Sec61beta